MVAIECIMFVVKVILNTC